MKTMKKRNKKRIGITNKRRFCFFCLTLIFLFCCGFSSVTKQQEKELETISVFVKPGDTLWDIASENNPNNRNLRRLVHEIRELNHKSHSTIFVGEELLIPV